MQYELKRIKKLHFIVTPSELREILYGFHHVVVNTGVRRSYTESNPEDFLSKYDDLYQKLKNSAKLIWNNDYDLVSFATGITGHLENCVYKPSPRLSSPNFLEPCPWLETFCFFPWKEQLTTSFSVDQFPENVCGLCLYFPSQIEYVIPNEKYGERVVANTELDDYKTYESLVSRVKGMTKLLKLEFNGKTYRTSVRISGAAKKDFESFYFVTANNIFVL